MRKDMKYTGLLTSLILLAGSTAASAQEFNYLFADEAGEFLHPYRGDINPFYGDINPFTGDISPFAGDINPFRGDINPFYGDISPFWGDINPFWGDINPFAGDINPFYGDINPFWGDISPFVGDINPFYGDINPFWEMAGPLWGDINTDWHLLQSGDTAGDITYGDVSSDLSDLLSAAEDAFGGMVTAQTGMSFQDAIVVPLLDEFGLDLNNENTLAEIDSIERSYFFLAFYDALMGYTGLDRVDHWMPQINWSPALAMEYNLGHRVIVGMIDFSVAVTDGSVTAGIGGMDSLDFNHGAAVASLIAAPIDGEGVMGVAPGAQVFLSNPFDESLTASWDDVAHSVYHLTRMNSHIINMSLGVPGWTFHQDWAEVFSSRAVMRQHRPSLFVFAAGNDGSVQTVDIAWDTVRNVGNILIVGSVSPTDEISYFSNRPGEACFTVAGNCADGHRLMDRYLVVPGELILTSDGEGGVTRQSGTSFAAPLVSGAAALVKGQWPWLPAGSIADLLLDTAQDLGEPGVDPVYGAGLLDVNAALSPVDWDNVFVIDHRGRQHSISDLYFGSGRLRFKSYGYRVPVFEVHKDALRDFAISLDDLRTVHNSSNAWSEADAYQYFAERLTSAYTRYGFNDAPRVGQVVGSRGDLVITAFASRTDAADLGYSRSLGFHTGLQLENGTTGNSFEFGIGEGAVAMANQGGFGLFSDHRPETGGVNPVLGFASGGAYIASDWAIADDTTVTLGITPTRESREFIMPGTGEIQPLFRDLAPYEAGAISLAATHNFDNGGSASIGFTQLHEATGLLGAQAQGAFSFDGGSDTQALTLRLNNPLTSALTLSTSATFARTGFDTLGNGQFELANQIQSTAYQVSMEYAGLFSHGDRARFSLVQPLHTEAGRVTFTSTAVTDRETGALGVVSENWELGGQRRIISELLYSLPVPQENMTIDTFLRVDLTGQVVDNDPAGLGAGATFSWRF